MVKFLKNILGLKEEIYSSEEWKAHSRSEIGMLRTASSAKNYKKSNLESDAIEVKIAKLLIDDHILNQRYSEPLHEQTTLKVRDFLESMVTYFFEICALFRRQIFDTNKNSKDFTVGIFKEIFIPQLVLILYSDLFVQKICNLNTSNDFNPTNGYYDLQQHLPINSPLHHLGSFLHIAIKEKNKQINFSAISREYCNDILNHFHSSDAYKEFKTSFLDKLTLNQIHNFAAIKGHFKSLKNRLKIENSNSTLEDEVDKVVSGAFGVMICGTVLERIRDILIHDFEYTVSQFEDFMQYFYELAFCVIKASSFRANFYELNILNCNYSFLMRNFPHLDSNDFPIENNLSNRIIDFLDLIENTLITKQYLLPENPSFTNLVTLNCIFNNNPQIFTHSKYSEDLKNNAQNNLNKSVDYKLELSEFKNPTIENYQNMMVDLKYYNIIQDGISWDTTSFVDISTVLKESIQELENYNFYLPLKSFSNCLYAFLNNNLDTAIKEINASFELVRANKQALHLGSYSEYILAFYLGLKAFSKAPNLLEIKKFIRYSMPINSDKMSVSIAQSMHLISKNIISSDEKTDLYISIYILHILGKFNYLCIKKNRCPKLANNPYEKVLSQFENFINSVIFNQVKGKTLEQCWQVNKPFIKSRKTILDKKIPYIQSNIINILNYPSEHFAIFNSLYLDGHNESRYIYHLLQEESNDLRNFILKKLTNN